MTREEVEEALESAKGGLRVYEEQYPHLKEQIKFQKVIINALEKQIPKKPNSYKGLVFECPECERMFPLGSTPRYCLECGQKIDWSEE